MIIHVTNNELEWKEIYHEDIGSIDQNIISVIQAEIFFYKNEEITVRSTIKIQEYSRDNQAFEVLTYSYAHVHPELVRVEFSDGKNLGTFNSLEEAKQAAQTFFNHHHHAKYTHPH